MPLYKITCQREIFYEFSIEADSESKAETEVNRIELEGNSEQYVVVDYGLELLKTEQI